MKVSARRTAACQEVELGPFTTKNLLCTWNIEDSCTYCATSESPSELIPFYTLPRYTIAMAEQSVNIPQVLVFIVVTFLAVRWYFSKPAAAGTRAPTSNRSTRQINPAQIDQLTSMFPQLSRRDIAWDLQRNGGNVAATTERVLSGRGLDTVSDKKHLSTMRG